MNYYYYCYNYYYCYLCFLFNLCKQIHWISWKENVPCCYSWHTHDFSSLFFFFVFFSLLEQCFSTAYFQLIILTKLGGLQAHLVFHFYRDFNVTHFLSNAFHFIIIIIIIIIINIIITLFRPSIICLFIYSFTYYWFKLGVSAAHINLKSYLDAPKAHLIVDIYIFRATGNVTFGNETTEVQNGTMKFFVEVNFYLLLFASIKVIERKINSFSLGGGQYPGQFTPAVCRGFNQRFP